MSNTPTEASSKEEVSAFFNWWKEGIYSKVFSKSTGKELLGFTEAQLRDFVDDKVDGSALYNELHPQGESNGTRLKSKSKIRENIPRCWKFF
jgi:hypothetical protein